MKRLFNYWREFFVDFNIWRKFRKAVRSQEDFLVENNMRVDWLGRVYTVINMPEEVVTNQEMVQQGWVLSQLGPMNEVLMKVGVSDYAYPEISRIPNANAYLIVMYPDVDALNPWRMSWNILSSALVVGVLSYLVRLVVLLEPVTFVKGLI